MAIEGCSSMQGVSENKWGHGPLVRTQPPPKSPGEEEQALEAMMDEIFRSDDEGVAPQSIAEDEDPRPSGLDILGALPDVPPRPTPWGPLAQSYALNDGPPPNRPFLYFKKLREVVVNADANVPHADPIFSEQQLNLWFTEPIFSARDWHPPFPWLSLMPSETLEAEWKHTVQTCGHNWRETIEPLLQRGALWLHAGDQNPQRVPGAGQCVPRPALAPRGPPAHPAGKGVRELAPRTMASSSTCEPGVGRPDPRDGPSGPSGP